MTVSWIVVGLAFGDEGKGTVIDFLSWLSIQKWLIRSKQKSDNEKAIFEKKLFFNLDQNHPLCQSLENSQSNLNSIHNVFFDLIVRHNGGSQAAHHVVLPDGRWHRFSQFGSGSFHGISTWILSSFIFDPLALSREVESLQNNGFIQPEKLLTISMEAALLTPYHAKMNQWREWMRKGEKHGSCGVGIGEVYWDIHHLGSQALHVYDLLDKNMLIRKLNFLRLLKQDQIEQQTKNIIVNPLTEFYTQSTIIRNYFADKNQVSVIADALCQVREQLLSINPKIFTEKYLDTSLKRLGILFESGQGILLDMDFGFWPHVTASHTDLTYVVNSEQSAQKVIGVMRPFMTRHGAGPLPTENIVLEKYFSDRFNAENPWQGKMRYGWLDLVLLRYSVAVLPEDTLIALTNVDQLFLLPEIKIATHYQIQKSLIHEKNLFSLVEESTVYQFDKVNQLYTIYQLIPQKIFAQDLPRRNQITELLKMITPVYQAFPKMSFEEKEWLREDFLGKAKKEIFYSLDKLQQVLPTIHSLVVYLQSRQALNRQIVLLSFGETYQDKMIISI